MSAKLSNEIVDSVTDGRYLLSIFEVEGPRVSASFLDVTQPHLADGDAEPRPDGFLVAVERRLRAVLDYLVETDFAVANAAGFESQLRQERRAATRELAFLLVALRRLVIAQFEDPDLANLALEPVNVRDTPTILARAVLVGERFEAENLARMLGRQRFDIPIDLEPYVAQIRDKAGRLAALSEEVNEAQRATDRARRTRKRAKEEYDRVYLRGARMFEDMCRFVGLDDLAARARRRKRRAASTEAVDEVPEQVDPVVEVDRDDEVAPVVKVDRDDVVTSGTQGSPRLTMGFGGSESEPSVRLGENPEHTAEPTEDGVLTPKGLHPSAQGKRSATLGRGAQDPNPERVLQKVGDVI